MSVPTFDEFAEFIRQFSGISSKRIIRAETQFEKDLGITGDDGVELLEAVENQFGVCLTDSEGNLRNTFELKPNEYLFHSEGFDLLPLWWFGIGHKPSVRDFAVGELYEAVYRQRT